MRLPLNEHPRLSCASRRFSAGMPVASAGAELAISDERARYRRDRRPKVHVAFTHQRPVA